ncbi:hypothetical protein TNCV_1785821 [Trichonephila clavipes]|nr:hypothetical protein TNCV_1785821 [Trichonephila clavipes]
MITFDNGPRVALLSHVNKHPLTEATLRLWRGAESRKFQPSSSGEDDIRTDRAANRELTHLYSPTNHSAPYPLHKSRTITHDFFPPKPDRVSAHDDDVTLSTLPSPQSPCHYRENLNHEILLSNHVSPLPSGTNTHLIGEGGSC